MCSPKSMNKQTMIAIMKSLDGVMIPEASSSNSQSCPV